MIKTKKLFVLVFLLLNCILFSACSQSKEVDFVKKYKIDLNTISDVTEVLQKAIDENKPVDELKKLSDELQQTMFSISQKAYEAVQKEDAASQSSANSESASSASDDKKDDDVIDAEYTKE